MTKILQNLWIITQNGAVIFNRDYNMTIDEQMFGAIMTSLLTFAERGLFKNIISSFNISDKQIYLSKKEDLIFITDTSEKIKVKKIEKELNKIIDRFFVRFPSDQCLPWECDINRYTDFKEEIEDSLKE